GSGSTGEENRLAPQREDWLCHFDQDGQDNCCRSGDAQGTREVQASYLEVQKVLRARRAEHCPHRRCGAHRGDASAVEVEALALGRRHSTRRDCTGSGEDRAGELVTCCSLFAAGQVSSEQPAASRTRRNVMAVMMRSMLEVADNSGARKLQIDRKSV